MSETLAQGVEREQLLVVAPFGNDGKVLSRVLSSLPCDIEVWNREVDDPVTMVAWADVLLLTAEGLHHDAFKLFVARLSEEPSWSNPPVVIIGEDRHTAEVASRRLRQARPALPVIILLRPCVEIEIRSAVSAALESRRAQKLVRDELGRREAAEDRANFLYRELSHRVQNMFAIIKVIAIRTEAESQDSKQFRDAFGSRIEGLSAVYAALRAKDGTYADVRAVIDGAVGAILADRSDKARLQLSGPELYIGSDVASSLGLVLHELASNARKYGALSVESGRVDIRWHDEGEHAMLFWQEIDGPAVPPPQREGFGTRVIKQSMNSFAKGSTDYRLDPSGVVCTIRFPLRDL
ncbi:sensor histidine kinase [Consotaella aegiceratis]|uniref:sensor histidine kinase n=1 Tax=Consotaella aegiceratis TaxID=3097961 RepID=UPI002F42B5CD